jgi:hypothetical protein
MNIPDPPINATAQRCLDVNPLPVMDPRIVNLDGQRRALPGITAEERIMLASSDGANLPQDSVDWIARVLPLQQALVVPFNPVMVSVEPCNMACVPTGTATGAKSCTYYQAKYSSKDSNPIAATASVLQMARQLQTAQQHIEAYPSVAEDAQINPLRRAMHLLQRTVNSLHSTMEISDQQAALTCLGHAADQCSHKMWLVYVGAAVKVRSSMLNPCHTFFSFLVRTF